MNCPNCNKPMTIIPPASPHGGAYFCESCVTAAPLNDDEPHQCEFRATLLTVLKQQEALVVNLKTVLEQPST